MELELKHIAPYLPYALNLKYVSKYEIDRLSKSDIILLKEIDEGKICINGYKTNNKSYLPILRPLSEIKSFEDIMDEFSEFEYYNFENAFFMDFGRSITCLSFVDYNQAQMIFKYHLDLFGLIDAGLAIDINTLSESDS